MRRISFDSYRFGRLSLRIVPILIWLAAIACVIVLHQRRTQAFQVLGLAQGQVYEVAATCTGRLKSVPVGLFEKVEQGQIVAVLDTVLDDEYLQDVLEAKLATILAEIDQLAAQLVPTQDSLLAEAANLQTDHLADQRQFATNIEDVRVEILKLKTLLETDKIMLEDLAVEVKIVQELLEKEAVSPYELQKVKVQYNTLAKKIETDKHVLEQLQSDLEQARQRRDEFAKRQLQYPSVDSALDVIRKQIRVQERLMDEVSVEIEALKMREAVELKTPFDGMVSQIQRWPGEVVDVNDPILTIAKVRATEVVAYASEDQAHEIREGIVVELVKSAEQPQIARSQVISVGPVLEQKPPRLWRHPDIPEWGRPFVVKVPPQMKLIIGERVGIRRL